MGARALAGRRLALTGGWELVGTAAVLTAAVLLTRIPFATRYLLNWDAAQFALGMARLDILHHQPHPPGYPGYVLAGRLLLPLTGSANSALIVISVAAECAAVFLAYAFARSLRGRLAGGVAALALLSSPLYWYYGEAANTYALEPPLVLGLAWLAWRCWRGEAAAAVPAAALLAVAGALRPSTAVLMAPLVAVAAWRSAPRATLIRALALAVAGTAAWVIPVLAVTGGLGGYLTAASALGADVTEGTAIWRAGLSGLRSSVAAVVLGTVWELGAFSIVLVAGAVLSRTVVRRRLMPRGWFAFGCLWAAPALATYLFVHIGQVVYVQTFTPALVLIAGPAVAAMSGALGMDRLRAPLALAAAAANALIFLLPPPSALAWQLRLHDLRVAQTQSTVRALRPEPVALITDAYGAGSYRLAQVYLPSVPRVAIGADRSGRLGEVYGDVYEPAGFESVRAPLYTAATGSFVFLDRSTVERLVADPERLRTVRLADGSRIYIWTGSAPRVEDGRIWLGARYSERRGAG